MKYHATRLDNVRWRSETMEADISEPAGMGTFIAFQGRDTALLGWHSDDDKTGEGPQHRVRAQRSGSTAPTF